jgi:hypothetical protein
MTDFKGHMWMTIEEFADCDYLEGSNVNPQLVVIDKDLLITKTVPLPEFVDLNRAAASLGNDDDHLYVGGYGYNAEGSILNLLQVHPQALHPDMVHGTAIGDVQEGIPVDIYTVNCGSGNPIDSKVTNSEGYYSFSGLEDGRYLLSADYSYNTTPVWVSIPQVEIESYDFIMLAD